MDRVAQIRIGPGATALADVQTAARAADTPLVWLIATDAEPADGALAPLLDAAPDAIAASVPVDSAGAPQEAWMGTFADADAEGVLRGALRHWIPLRFSPVYSLLAPRDVLESEAPPDAIRYGPYSDLEWTARLFAHRPGLLATDSHVRVGPRRLPLEPGPLTRLVRSEGFRATDALRVVRLARGRGE